MAARTSVLQDLAGHDNAQVKRGGSILEQSEHFSEVRRCRDVIWAFLFLIVAGVVVCGAVAFSINLWSMDKNSKADTTVLHLLEDSYVHAMLSLFVAGLASLGFSVLFLLFAQHNAECVVWTCLLLGPVCAVASGAAMMASSWPMPGVVGLLVFGLGILLFILVFCCWKDLVPLTVLLLRTVIHVVRMHSTMIMLSIFGAALAILWSVACFTSLLAVSFYDEEIAHAMKEKTSRSPMKALVFFCFAFMYYWGSIVSIDTAFTSCSGVFGRWYFQKDRPDDAPISKSLKVACTTSFGSICFGSFCVAVVRAVEFVVGVLRREAQEDGNIVLCCLLAVVECIVECIGDILQWVCSWAYVQCAVRGVGFCDACSATFSLCTFANMDAICASTLIDSVPYLGALIVGLLSGGVGFLSYHAAGASASGYAISVFACSFWLGTLAAWAALMPLKAGASTVIVCFAEEPDFLRRQAPALYEAFVHHCGDVSSEGSRRSSRNSLQLGDQARDLRAAPLMEMGPVGQRKLQVTVPEGVLPGQMVQVRTPEGQLLQVAVPLGYSPGQAFVANY
ncbi:unnamed protein product [Effrenium voratum]|uniref:Choline transporter-like protein n=1 Tax=Effrenium voratum TaxID=2562239 RepID=A0AA36HV64_9DINO|nr:unnamed protein product [Effrenium voratum]